ncbi:hypothetical protein [Amphritea pacifica]|uniref:Uncharacterized protein n=1 Tax=Amphritea pacifica TaxID=2811233 RepID=A0ABS2W8J3_9GAMM|nr:hypothetical protein [Amphritea pacifica]MBN0988037.1 hypothetical protein [Amphritea pacifica]
MQILEQMSEKGDVVDMYLSMQRLTSILDGAQYLEFINWTKSLQVIKPKQTAHNQLAPFTLRKYPVDKRKDKLVVANIENTWGVTIG